MGSTILFLSLSNASVSDLIDKAIEIKEENLVNEHIKTASKNAKDLNTILNELKSNDGILRDSRAILGEASKHKEAKKSWFKSVSAMETVARDIIGPALNKADSAFQAIIYQIFEWIKNEK